MKFSYSCIIGKATWIEFQLWNSVISYKQIIKIFSESKVDIFPVKLTQIVKEMNFNIVYNKNETTSYW